MTAAEQSRVLAVEVKRLESNENTARCEVSSSLDALRCFLDQPDGAVSVSSLRAASSRAASAIAARNQATVALKIFKRNP